MAYIHYHNITFQNRITGDVLIQMYKKDGDPDFEPTELQGLYANKQYQKGDGERFDTIIASELLYGIRLPYGSPYTYDDFLVSFHDEWKVVLINEGNIEFIGFLTPGEGSARFRDLPYELDLTATDGLGFLKTDSISNVESQPFTATHTLLEYLTGILAKTRLQLNVRTYCNIYESSMPDRITDPQSDALNLAKMDFRTFQNDDNSSMDCYTALSRLLKEGFNVCQWFGRWVIVRIGELQESTGPKIWYSEYDYTGAIIDAQLEGFEAGKVAKDQVLHPRNADADISTMFALKFAKHNYLYTAWPELPRNNKFERGTAFEEGELVPSSAGTYKKFSIDDWLYGITNPSIGSTQPPNGMLPTTDLAYRYSEYNIFGVEQSREIRLERNGDGPGHRFLRSEGMPVKAGGRITINIDFKTSAAGTGTRQYLMVMLERPSGIPYRLAQLGGIPNDGIGTLIWANTTSLQFVAKNYQTGEDAATWNSFSINLPALPVDGTLYVLPMMFDPPVGRIVYYRNFSLEYTPMIANGYVQVKGDYWNTVQNPDYKDSVTEEVYISDSSEKIFKGALLQNDGQTLTGRTWHRLNVNENREFKELVNLARYNASYRRCKRISGTFGGTTCRPINAQTEVEPLSFHRHYTFPDDTALNGKYFVLVPPLTIDYSGGYIKAVFAEALDENTDDGDETGNTHEFKFIF